MLIACALRQWLHERASVLRLYVQCRLVDSGLAQIRSRFLDLFPYSDTYHTQCFSSLPFFWLIKKLVTIKLA